MKIKRNSKERKKIWHYELVDMASSWLEMMFICAFFSLQQPQRDLISYLTKRWHYTTLRPIRNARSSSWDLRVLEDMSWGWGSLRTQVALRPQYLVSIHLQSYPENCVLNSFYVVFYCFFQIYFTLKLEFCNGLFEVTKIHNEQSTTVLSQKERDHMIRNDDAVSELFDKKQW